MQSRHLQPQTSCHSCCCCCHLCRLLHCRRLRPCPCSHPCSCAGAETGDGRDESNKSLSERLADAQNAQTAADAEARAADIKLKHLTKQAAEQRKALASKDKEAGAMRTQLDAATSKVEQCTAALQVMGQAGEEMSSAG